MHSLLSSSVQLTIMFYRLNSDTLVGWIGSSLYTKLNLYKQAKINSTLYYRKLFYPIVAHKLETVLACFDIDM